MRVSWPARGFASRLNVHRERGSSRWIHQSPTKQSRGIWREARSESWLVHVSAIVTGILLGILLFRPPNLPLLVSYVSFNPAHSQSPKKLFIPPPWLAPDCLSPSHCWALNSDESLTTRRTGQIRPTTSNFLTPDEPQWTLDQVRGMVSKTNGFYARDWSVSLGWNNVRILHLAIPSRNCVDFSRILPDAIYY